MPVARAFPLSRRMRDLLKRMWENRDTEEGELTCSIPGGWWLGNEQVSGSVCTWILRYSLFKRMYTNAGNGGMGTYTVYAASEEVGKLLNDPDYVPEGAAVVKALAMR